MAAFVGTGLQRRIVHALLRLPAFAGRIALGYALARRVWGQGTIAAILQRPSTSSLRRERAFEQTEKTQGRHQRRYHGGICPDRSAGGDCGLAARKKSRSEVRVTAL